MTEPQAQNDMEARRSQPRWAALILLPALAVAYMVATRADPVPEGWSMDYEAALREADAGGGMVFAKFSMPGCVPCVLMDRTVLAEDSVKKVLDRYTLVSLDLLEHKSLADRLDVYGTPTYVILDSKGQLLSKMMGEHSTEEFMSFIERAAESDAPANPPEEAPPTPGP